MIKKSCEVFSFRELIVVIATSQLAVTFQIPCP
jgi:hypothetical protein